MNPNKRLLSLDVLRGITVAGMILVNNTGKCGYNFAAFAHAKWDGFSPADPEIVKRLRAAGFRGFLIGETFMKTQRPGETLQNFLQAIQ